MIWRTPASAAEGIDAAKIEETLNGVVEVLQSYVDTCGIWIKGAGCSRQTVCMVNSRGM